jgi:MFS family permease
LIANGGQLLLLAIAALAGTYARATLGSLQEALRASLALSDNQIALIQGPALALPFVLAAVPLGLLIDRYSRVRLLLVLSGLNVLGSVLTAFAPGFGSLLAARCLIGLSAWSVSPVAVSLIADLYAPAQRGRALMTTTFGQIVGHSAAYAFGGWVLARMGGGADNWRWTMLWLTVPLVPVALMMLALSEPQRTGHARDKPSVWHALSHLWRYRALVASLLAGIVIVQIAEGAAAIWLMPTFSRQFGLAPDRIGAIMAVGLLISGLVGPAIGGTLADRCHRAGGPNRTLSILCVLALLCAGTSLFPLMPGAGSATVVFIAFLTVGAAINVAATVLLTVTIPSELRGLSVSLLTGAGLVAGLGLAPLTVSLLSGAIGGPAMIGKALTLVSSMTSLLGAAAFIFSKRFIPREAAV